MPLSYQQQKEWFRGLTDDRFSGSGYVADINGCNIRQGTRGVVLSNSVVVNPVGQPSGTENIYGFMFGVRSGLPNTTRLLLGDRILEPVSSNFSNISTIRNGVFARSAGVNYGVIITGNTDIQRWDNDGGVIGSRTTLNLLSGSANFRPVLVDGGYIYVGGNGVVDAIEITSSTWVRAFTVNIPGQCRAITKIGDQIFLYSSDGLNGYKMSWDGVADFPLYIQKWADNPIMNVANIDNVDYVISGNDGLLNQYRRLYLSAGYEKQLLSASDFILNRNQLFNFYPVNTNAIETYGNVIYIPSTNSIYVYGTNKGGLPVGLGRDIRINEVVDEITALAVDNNTLYIGYTASGVVKWATVDLKSGFSYGSGGYIDTVAWDGGDIETEKTLNRLVINSYTPTGTTIELYARIDDKKYWVFTATSNPTIKPVKGDTYTYGGLTYTVDRYIESKRQIVCTRDWLGMAYDTIQGNSGTLTRTYGVGDASIPFTEVNNYIYIDTISGNDRKTKITYQVGFYDIQIRAVLTTNNIQKTPELYSIKALFDYKDLQNG